MAYKYEHAYVVRVSDGDTIVVDIDFGFHSWVRDWRVRIEGVNAPDKDDPDGWTKATDFVNGLVKPGDAVSLESHRLDQYGRIYGTLTTADGVDIGQALLDSGLAVKA